MMTREEAIKALRLERGIEINGNAVRVAEFLQGLDVAISALRPVSREQVENYLYRITYDLLEGVVEEKAQGMSVRQEDKELIATLYKYLFVGLMLDWIKGDMKGDPQVMVQKLELVIHGSVAAALNRMRTDKPASNGAE